MKTDPKQIQDNMLSEAADFAENCVLKAIDVAGRRRIPWALSECQPLIASMSEIIAERVNTKLMILSTVKQGLESEDAQRRSIDSRPGGQNHQSQNEESKPGGGVKESISDCSEKPKTDI